MEIGTNASTNAYVGSSQVVSGYYGDQFVPGWGAGMYSLLSQWDRPTDDTVYLWRSFQSTSSYEMWAPSDNDGHYTCARFSQWTSSILTIGRLREGMIGTTVHHSSGSVTKTGTWANSANTNTFGGSSSQSSTAGDTIACSVTGSTLGLRLLCTTNGGYATVAIDGDYTAATSLPLVTQALIDAGKFTAGQLGHRYLSCYANTSNVDLADRHVLLAENLPIATYAVTVRAAGSAPAGTGNRAYIAAFIGCSGEQLPGDAGTAMLYVRDVTNAGTGDVSSMTLAWTVKPTGTATGVFIGDNHGNETLTSSAWKVDGVAAAPAVDEIISGTVVTLERVVDQTHPEAVGSIATKTDTFSCRANRRYQIQYDWSVTWAQSGELSTSYCGMLNHHNGGTGNVVGADVFRAGVVGDAAYDDFIVASAPGFGNAEETAMGFFDPDHSTVAAVTVPDPTQSLNGWTYSVGYKAFISETGTNAKAYFTRAASATPEPITISQVMSGSCGWRVFRIADAYDKITARFL
jgi:hypothetical protein